MGGILKNFKILRASIIAKYYIKFMLLFVYNRSQNIFGHAHETFISLRLKKQNTGICIPNNFFFTSMKKND